MKRLLSLLLAVVLISTALISCGKKYEINITTPQLTTAATDTVLSPDGTRKPFEECSFYDALLYVDSVYKQNYLYEYNSDEVYAELKELYNAGEFDTLEGEDLILTVANRFINIIGDDYGVYFTVDSFKEFNEERDVNHVGIGISVLQLLNFEYESAIGGIMVTGILEGSKAHGVIEIGDIIIKVDGERTKNENYESVIKNIRGEVGTKIGITVLRGVDIVEGTDGEKFGYDLSDAVEVELEVERVNFLSHTVEYEMLEDGIGYIRITGFENNTPNEFIEAFVELIDSGAKDFVFDVRSNPGGTVGSVLAVLSMILDYDESSDMRAIFTTADKTGKESDDYKAYSEKVMDYYDISPDDVVAAGLSFKNIAEEYAYFADLLEKEAQTQTGTDKEWSLETAKKYRRYSEFDFQLPKDSKVAVLTNSATASAGELFTKILSDFGVSYTVGVTTYGKGSMQTIMNYSGSSTVHGAIKLTTHTYKSPYSPSYDITGIEPDKTVMLDSFKGNISLDLIDRSEDNQLDAAIEYIKSKK